MNRTILAAALSAWLFLFLFAGALAEDIHIAARAAVLIDGETGRALFAQNADTRYPMASTTKIMTALLALERCGLDEIVTASKNASGVPGTSIYLGEGEQLTMREMLLGLMLRSGNDAAVAIAEHVSGSVEAFADLMNARAAALGADARFVTPNGLDAPGHGASARAMALIAREALKDETFREIVSTQRAVIPWRDREYSRVLVNKNRLLKEYEGATGVKTGFTTPAGRCLVFSARRDGLELVGVVMNCGDWFGEAKRLLDWGFSRYTRAEALPAGRESGRVPVAGGVKDEVAVAPRDSLAAALCAEDDWRVAVDLAREVKAPVAKGEKLGAARLVAGGETIAETDLLACEDVARLGLLEALRRAASRWPAPSSFGNYWK
ncbi:MAG: D-alanyl-D-alanine carboxypeptidase [Clostridia bacterium]|nr:D-alanyl-D-alanine carboxypeptidase [Clostridia bacterium]